MSTPPPLHVLGVYDDAPDFGEHEELSCRGLEALAREADLGIVCFFPEVNRDLARRLRAIASNHPNVRLRPMGFSCRRLEGLRALFSRKRLRALANRFRLQRVGALLAVQRDIETSIMGILAARRNNIPSVSLLELPHRLRTRQAPLACGRDLLNARLIGKPAAYLTSCESMKTLLRERGARQPIEIVPPPFSPGAGDARDPAEARARLNLPRRVKLVGMIDPVEFQRKRHDFLLRSFAENYARMEAIELVFIGDGPDLARLRHRARDLGVFPSVHFVPGNADRGDLLAALDLLCLPSQFESVPRALIDAQQIGLPVVASARDGMTDLLPAEWLFPPDDPEACAERLLAMLATPQGALSESARNRTLAESSPARFAEGFVAAVRQLTGLETLPGKSPATGQNPSAHPPR